MQTVFRTRLLVLITFFATTSEATEPPTRPTAPTRATPAADSGKKSLDGKEVGDSPRPAGWRPTTREEFAELAKDGPLPPWLPFRGQKRVHDEKVDGTVVSVNAGVIELEVKGKNDTVKYPAHELLSTGAVCHWLTDSCCYLLDDVKKGDVVIVGVGVVDKKRGEECFYVSIRKRPGKEVPASRKVSEAAPHHKIQQARNEYEEKGTPIPKHLK